MRQKCIKNVVISQSFISQYNYRCIQGKEKLFSSYTVYDIPYTTVNDRRQYEYFGRWQFWAHYKIIIKIMNEVIQREKRTIHT